MKNLKLSLLLVLLIIFGLSGCNQVGSIHPVGSEPVSLNPEDWNGKWGLPFEKEFLRLRVLDGDNGMLRMVSYDSKGEPEKSQDVLLRRVDGWTFASVAKEGGGDGYLFARINNSGGRTLLVWLPDYDRFRGLVEKGVLPGKTDPETVTLGLLLAVHLKLITSGEVGTLFDWDDPVVLIRLDR